MPFINNESKHMEQVTLLLSKKVLSTFGRNDLYIQLVGQLSYTDGKFISDGKFIMKKSSHNSFSSLPKEREVRQDHR